MRAKLSISSPDAESIRHAIATSLTTRIDKARPRTVAGLREIIAGSKGAILTDYRGLTVAEVSNLRKKLRDNKAEYHIVKNTLFKLALGGQLTPELESLLTGPTAIVFAQEDIVAPAKTILDFVVDCIGDENSDSFGWAPTVRLLGKASDPTMATDWSSRAQFGIPAKVRPAPLKPLEQLAQVVLLSNEFSFVD